MNKKGILGLSLLLALLFAAAGTTVAQSKVAEGTPGTSTSTTTPLVTFIEVGSVNCIPCKAMQPVMRAIEAKYGDQVKVIFYDVWTKEQAHFAREYKVRLIPTQVFLDADGKEFSRHEGFFPEEAIDQLLQKQGLKVKTGT